MNETDRTLRVSFDGRSIEYDVTELDELVHAYATTIHKAQGSEYPIRLLEKRFKDFDNCICLTYEGYSLEIMDLLIKKVFSLLWIEEEIDIIRDIFDIEACWRFEHHMN